METPWLSGNCASCLTRRERTHGIYVEKYVRSRLNAYRDVLDVQADQTKLDIRARDRRERIIYTLGG